MSDHVGKLLRDVAAVREENRELHAEALRVDAERAALREENAREREAHLHWKAEAHKATVARDQLRAQLAALVEAARERAQAMANLYGEGGMPEKEWLFYLAVRALDAK